MKAKPRGSLVGLRKSRAELRLRNTDAMIQAVAELRIAKPDSKWTFKEVWTRAGLKSQIALDSPWNAHVRAAIESHNSSLQGLQERTVSSGAGANRPLLNALRDELRTCKQQRDQALSQIGQLVADAEFFRKKCEDLTRTVELLRKRAR